MTQVEAAGRGPRRRLTVLVLTPFGLGGMGGIDRLMDELRARAGVVPDITMEFLTTRGPGSLLWSPFFLARAMLQLIGYRLARGRCVCHVNLGSRGSTYRKLLLCWLARALGHGYVIHLHGARFHVFFRNAAAPLRGAIRRLNRRAGSMIVLGEFWRDFAVGTLGLDPSRVVVLPNASARRPARPPEEDGFRILFLGRVGGRKGVPVLLEALGRLARTDLRWRAEIAGDGDLRPFIAQAESLGIADRVTFPGWLDGAAVDERLARASVLVLPSELEGLPMAIVEAYAWGTPVIATPVGSVPDVLQDGEQGLVMQVGDAAGLAAALQRLAGDPPLRRRMGENARRFFEQNLELDAYLRRLADCWRSAARRA